MKKVTGIRNGEQSIVTGINHDSLLLGLSDSTTVLGQCQHQESYGIADSNTQRLPCSGVMMCGQEAFGLRDLSLWSRIWGIVQSSFYRCVYGVNFKPNVQALAHAAQDSDSQTTASGVLPAASCSAKADHSQEIEVDCTHSNEELRMLQAQGLNVKPLFRRKIDNTKMSHNKPDHQY